MYHYHTDNTDVERFGNTAAKQKPLQEIIDGDIAQLRKLQNHFKGFGRLYALLENRQSRDLLVDLVTYFLLGKERVKLPLNTADYWRHRDLLGTLVDTGETIPIPFMNWKLSRFSLAKIGFPINLYGTMLGILCIFVLKQYEYSMGRLSIGADKGDIVIDGGGCWGDSALFFAHRAGKKGHVYTLEFVESNVDIIQRNLELNPRLMERITIIQRPLWDKSDETLYSLDQGPASRVGAHRRSKAEVAFRTLSIDDLVKGNAIPRVDLIKMDIEGAELAALKGAKGTLKRFRPKLAISLYHDLDDFGSVPEYLGSLDIGYRFYLKHSTIYGEETVLFAATDKRK